MTYKTATPAQRREVNRFATIVSTATHAAREDFSVNGADVKPVVINDAYVGIDAALTKLAVSLVAVGASGETPLPSTSVVVANGGTCPIKNSAGVAQGASGTMEVAGGALVSCKLPANIAPVKSGLSTVAATGTGTKVTFTVANGVITAITLSA